MKQNLLLLHGALGTKAQFNSLQQHLTAHFTVHTFDFSGHGRNASTAPYSIDLFTCNVVDYLAENNITKTHLFGYSMGGYVGLNLARQQPELVDRVITLATKFAWSPASAEKEVRMLNPAKIVEKVPAFAQHLASIHTANDWQDVMHRTAQMMLALGADKKLTTEELTQIKHPVLIGIGSEDKMVSIEESRASATALPQGELAIIAGFQHPIDRVDQEELAAIIVRFLM